MKLFGKFIDQAFKLLFMFSPKYLLSIVFLLIVAQSAFGQDCYQVQRSNSGGEAMMYTEQLQATACDLQDLLQTDGITDFAIIGKDYYPLMAYVNPVGYYNQVHEEAVASVEQQHDSYIMVAKDHLENSQLNYRVEIKFPTTGLLSTLSPFERGALEQQVYDAIAAKAAEYDNMATFNATVEAEGLQVLVEAMGQLMDGTFGMAGALEKAGFDRVPVGTSATVQRSEDDIDPTLYDYAGLKIIPDVGSPVLFRDMMGQASLPNSLTSLCIFTDNNNTGEQLNSASSDFENANENLILWIHLVDGDGQEEDSLYVKSMVNLTLDEAQAAMSFCFKESNWEDSSEPTTASQNGEASGNRSVNNNNGPYCDFGGDYGKRCILPTVDSFAEGIPIGLLDGLLDVLYFCYDTSKSLYEKIKELAIEKVEYGMELFYYYLQKGSMVAVFVKYGNDKKEDFVALIQQGKEAYTAIKALLKFDPMQVLNKMLVAIQEWFGEIISGTPIGGYNLGKLIYGAISFALGGGVTQISSIFKEIMGILKHLADNIEGTIRTLINRMRSSTTAGLTSKIKKCEILGKGCFIAGTPVLIANKTNSILNAKSLAVAAAMPIVAVPIQDVQLLDYALAHETVNSTYGLTVSTDHDIYLGLRDKDPYTSDQQRERDEYELDNENWHEVVFEEVYGGSTARLALHSDWINQKGYQVDAVVEMNLPEQGISGPFRITAIKHILPQKRPEDEDAGQGFVFRPVTGIFIHQSNDVWTLEFDSGDTLGVTANHPVYSTTAQDWRLAGELAIGEQVLTHAGSATLTGKRPAPAQRVYNLEVQAVHNFLVAEVGVVVHNSCDAFWNKALRYAGNIIELPIDHIWRGHSWANRLQPVNVSKTVFSEVMTKQKIKDLVNKMLEDPDVNWELTPGSGKQLRALVDGTKYSGFPSVIGHGPQGQGVINTIRVTVIDDGGDIVIKNAFPSTSIGF